ncbi:SCO family protein [Blastopirellula marina]|uniref:SCO family protein n=1 Tax=Blastopirellula marina TaxID=124 RepID=A0A2S8FPB5_9BACT|nr:SCO family protein [Blastopirellula marina]PQO33694.1 SCO family protein [Blastopirellula marina]PTL43481.1 SCO family protein [Blastopirellula marina]
MVFGLLRILDCLATFDQEARSVKISDAIPNVPVTNQFGKTVLFRDAFVNDDTALVINSVYTTCKGSCPVTSAAIEQLRKTLSPIFGKSLKFLSFTVEPLSDTPDVLMSYAEIFGADKLRPELSDWLFLNANPVDTDTLRRSLGLFDLNPRIDADVSEHASLLVVGNVKTDRWCSLPAELRQLTLVESIRRVAGFTFEQRYGIPQDL